MFHDGLKLVGAVSVVLTGPDGQVKDRRDVHNLVVTAGKNFVASRMVGTAQNAMSYMAVGTNGTAAAVGDTTLGTELSGRVALTSGTATNNVVTYTATFGAGVSTGSLQEAGLFNAATNGTMLARVTFGVVNKGAGDALTITWTVTAS
jgi:hypothetical protein